MSQQGVLNVSLVVPWSLGCARSPVPSLDPPGHTQPRDLNDGTPNALVIGTMHGASPTYLPCTPSDDNGIVH
ncbi:hypothetical protein BJX62DRAFT_205885 [Aspergillus germanicus]